MDLNKTGVAAIRCVEGIYGILDLYGILDI